LKLGGFVENSLEKLKKKKTSGGSHFLQEIFNGKVRKSINRDFFRS